MNEINQLTEFEQTEMCQICEKEIIFCNSSSSTYLCEGKYCIDAYDKMLEREEPLAQLQQSNKILVKIKSIFKLLISK